MNASFSTSFGFARTAFAVLFTGLALFMNAQAAAPQGHDGGDRRQIILQKNAHRHADKQIILQHHERRDGQKQIILQHHNH
jgi:hypothetical protein